MKTKEITRSFNGSDVYLTETARTTHTLFTADLAKFTAFDPTMTAAFATQFLAAVTAAEVVVADTAIVQQLGQKTELVATAMEKAKSKYNDVKYFAQKAFPDSPATQGEFGLNNYDKARKSTPQMIQFLDEMSKACIKYQTQLLDKGYSEAAIAEIQTIRTELLNSNAGQEVFKKQRPKLTEDRIIILNTCYNWVTQVNAAAQLVYKTDLAKQKQFVYNPSSASASEEYAGEIAAGTTLTIATIPFKEDTVFLFKNTGTVPLIFCLSTSANIAGIQVPIGGGATITKTSAELNANATFLLVKNTDAALEGSYQVTIDS